MTPKRKRVFSTEGKKLEPAAAVVRKAKPCNDNRPTPAAEQAGGHRADGAASRATHKMSEDNPKPAIVTTTGRKRRISDGPPLPMELPLSRKPAEHDGDDYKRLKAAMTRRLRGE